METLQNREHASRDNPPVAVPYATEVAAVVAGAEVDPERGLTDAQVRQRRELVGPNQLTEAPPVSVWRKLFAQFKDLVIWILIFAAIVSGALGEWIDTMAILAIVLLNGVIGFFQEARAERALAALQKLSAPIAKVLRAGGLASVPAKDLVPGDIVEIEAGDNIPADARLAAGLQLDRAGGVADR